MLVKQSLDLEAAADHRIDLSAAGPAGALFTSDLSARLQHTPAEVTAAIGQAIRIHGGIEGCMAAMASAYGEHPETAAPRMRWARAVVESHRREGRYANGHGLLPAL